MKGGNLQTGAMQEADSGLVYDEKLSGTAGGIYVPEYSTLRVRAAAGCTVTMNVEQHLITFSLIPAALGHTWQLTFGVLGATAGLTDGSNAAAIQAAIRAINASLNKVIVLGTYQTGFTIDYVNYVGTINVPTVTVNNLTDATPTAVVIKVGKTIPSYTAMTLLTGEIVYFNAGQAIPNSPNKTVFFNFNRI